MKNNVLTASVHLSADASHKVEINFALHKGGNSWVSVWIGANQLTIHGTVDQVEHILQGLRGGPARDLGPDNPALEAWWKEQDFGNK